MWDNFALNEPVYEATGHKIAEGHLAITLGEYIHALEDSFSHEEYGPVTGQAIDYLKGKNPNLPDYTDTNPERADRMAKATFDALVRAANEVRSDGKWDVNGRPVSYNAIKGLIDQFSKESDRDKKRQILEKIMGEITRARHLHESYQD